MAQSTPPSTPPLPPPPSPDTLLRRAIFLASRGRPQAALSTAEKAKVAHEAAHKTAGLAPYLVQIGAIHHALQDLSAAEAVLRRAISISPSHIEALCGLAVVLKAKDSIHVPECLELLRRARLAALTERNGKEIRKAEGGTCQLSLDDVSSQLAVLLTDVGVRLKMASLPAQAIQHYKEALEVCPTYSHALYNLGVAYTDAGEPKKALECYEQCLQRNPSYVEAWCNLGVLHRNQGNIHSAMQAYERALSNNPNFELAKTNLAAALCEEATATKEKNPSLAKKLYKRALALKPSYADAHYNLGVLYAEGGQLERALVSYSLAVHFNPEQTEAHNNLGVIHKELGNMEMALQCYEKALTCDKQHHRTHNNIAVVYTLLGNVDAASQHLRIANSISPDYAEAHNNIGVLLRDQGEIDSAIFHYERCIELDPRAGMAAQNRLHALSYSEKWTKAEVYHQHMLWGRAFQERLDKEIVQAATGTHAEDPIAVHLMQCLENPPRPDPDTPRGPGTDRPLRIGYLSPDFFTHSVSYFAEVLLTHFDPTGFAVYAYANVERPDAKTERFKSLIGDNWRNIWGMTPSAASKLIIDDKIDILVELAGHTANNRLDIMALRLAPVQVTWIGYPNTTGLPSIHYRVTDGVVDPPNTSQQFSEKLWRLPDVFLCYTPSLDAPEEPSAPPALNSGGIITFGSFNVLAKSQSRTIKLWASILHRVPDSRLLLKAKPFATASAKKRMEALFEEEGITADRLDLAPLIPSTRSHLQVYSNIDVALDPFPYAGTTTTCEALYMGVPVITLGVKAENGDHAHNVGVTLLSAIGHPELIAFTEEEYIEKAVDLGTDLERLQSIRRGLRKDMMQSALGDAKRYIRNVEGMFCGMWAERGGRLSDASTEVGDAQYEGCYAGMGEESGGSTAAQSQASSETTENSEQSSSEEVGEVGKGKTEEGV